MMDKMSFHELAIKECLAHDMVKELIIKKMMIRAWRIYLIPKKKAAQNLKHINNVTAMTHCLLDERSCKLDYVLRTTIVTYICIK